MKIRAFASSDLEKLKEIWEKFYKNEFEFPQFHDNYITVFIVTDDDDNIITGGGLRYTVEATFLTDKDASVRDRRAALYNILESCEYITQKSGFHKLHVITDEEGWKKHLMKVGFHSRGDCLVIDL